MKNICNMPNDTIQAILGGVEKPSRYIGTEINRVLKDPSQVRLRMTLAFPDLYDIGTSHFGIQILYHLMNRHTHISVERVFAPAGDMERALRENGLPLFSLETRTPLRNFDVIGFSLLYELNFTNVLNMLDLAGIALYADQRGNDDPLVIGGGPCVANPEPMAPFFDAMVFGDGENVLPAMAEIWMQWKQSGGKDRKALFSRWSTVEGVYIPSFFKAHYDENGFQRLTPLHGVSHIRRAIVPDLEKAFFPERPIIPFGKPIHDRLRLEISRGCSRGCRFCQAGMIYRPVRERSPRTLLDITDQSLAATGYEDLSLLSLSTGDYSGLGGLIAKLMQRCSSERTAVSLPSIRAGTLNPELMEQIKKVRKTGFTIAPEAGSQRLRDVINKNVSFDDIKGTVNDAFTLGWQVIKLYFMLGLPTESDADLDAIVQLVSELRKIKSPGKRRGQINVSFSTFIPKAHTPFQWAAQIGLEESRSKIDWLKKQLRIPGVQVKWQHPAMSLLEGVVARGDRRLAGVIERAFRSGCRFDGWNDHFDFERWNRAFADSGISIDFFTTRQRSTEEPLPWAHMNSRVDVAFLKSQLNDALAGARLGDCRRDACHQCGVCDFKEIKPMRDNGEIGSDPESGTVPASSEKYHAVEVIYSKRDEARFFGHLEVAHIFARALRRARIDVIYSQGFHPMPRISFSDPLPLGMESCGETMVVRVAAHVGCDDLLRGLGAQLPQGLQIIKCRSIHKGGPRREIEVDHYHVFALDSQCPSERIAQFHQTQLWPYRRCRKERTQDIDLKTVVWKFERRDAQTIELSLRRKENFSLRPHDILRGVFSLDASHLSRIRVLKLAPAAVEQG
jgi:radical SAM family uncharacterized protein/radical SAM-linked protein